MTSASAKIEASTGDIAAQKKNQRKERLKRLVSLRLLLSVAFAVLVVTVSTTMLVASYRSLKANKTADVLGIFFLEIEHQANKINADLIPKIEMSRVVWSEPHKTGSVTGVISEYQVMPSGELRFHSGRNLGLSHLKSLGVQDTAGIVTWNSWRLGNKRYLGFFEKFADGGGRLAFFAHPKKLNFDADKVKTNQTLVYAVTRQGDLLYANSKNLNRKNVDQRVMVQRFIYTPLWQGQLELKDPVTGARSYGFFRELPGTNVVLFAEIPAEMVERTVVLEMVRLLKNTGTIALITLILSQIMIWFFLRPMGILSRAAEVLAAGKFDVDIRPMSFGEVRILSESMMRMVQGLAKRDRTINELIEEQREMARLEGELKIANAIQTSLLPSDDPKIGESFLQVAVYEPAAEVAGDWYNYCYDPTSNKGVMVIVDISGHGAGSSMFTAMTAAVFEEFRQTFADNPEPTYFFEALNRQLLRYGKKKWSATAQAVFFDGNEGKAHIYNAGHLAPLYDAGGPERGFKPVKGLSSTLLGVEEKVSLAKQSVDFNPMSQIILYTDGVVERRGAKMRTYGVRRMMDFLNLLSAPVAKKDLAKLLNEADNFASRSPRLDDICVVALQRLSA